MVDYEWVLIGAAGLGVLYMWGDTIYRIYKEKNLSKEQVKTNELENIVSGSKEKLKN